MFSAFVESERRTQAKDQSFNFRKRINRHPNSNVPCDIAMSHHYGHDVAVATGPVRGCVKTKSGRDSMIIWHNWQILAIETINVITG
ncbi:hypothetical protein Rcae01_01031 [Novipirellula caenicola]|uniref:Uncharacterized protein n=1 Tax=Novipirellula caenicola TaxID=1536901 RepID=A0ABP9VLB8_9BACT